MKGHAVVWCCEAAGHGGEVFDSPEELQQHLEDHHSNAISKNQIPYLLKKSEKVIEDPFIRLTIEYDPTYSYEPEKTHKCLFCLDYSTNLQQPTDDAESGKEMHSRIYQHTLEHLEALALLSLPEKDIPDFVTGLGSDSSKWSLETGEQPSIAEGRDLDPDLPSLSNDDYYSDSESDDSGIDQAEIMEDMSYEATRTIPELVDSKRKKLWRSICSNLPPLCQPSYEVQFKDDIILAFSDVSSLH